MRSFSARSSRPADDAQRLRQIFERRAATFGAVAFLPREIAQRMGERLEYIKIDPAGVLDAGCGRGEDLSFLAKRFPEAAVFGVDLSGAMLAQARAHAMRVMGRSRWLPAILAKLFGRRGPRVAQADFLALPFPADALDFVWSNLALHWHSRPDLVFPEWRRALRVNGLLMFSTLGPDTLRELRRAYAQAEASLGMASRARVIEFVDMHDLGDMLVDSGFEIPVMDQEMLTVTYSSSASLLADVRLWGAYPFERAASPDGGGRRLRQALDEALDAQRRPDGTLALTFEVIYGHAWKAVPRATPEGHGIVRVEDIKTYAKRL